MKDHPWVNSLGMKLVPVPDTEVFFSIWDTRVQDFSAFADATNYDAAGGMRSLGKDGWKQPLAMATAFVAWCGLGLRVERLASFAFLFYTLLPFTQARSGANQRTSWLNSDKGTKCDMA
jgi:hypothetical protein